jgi:hypothetical protein
MTTERRLDHLEEGLPPKEGTLLWLAEAHQHGSLLAYSGWLVDRPLTEAPLVRLDDQAIREVRRRLKGLPCEQLAEAEEQADRDVAFLFELVMMLNGEADKLVREGGLRYGMLFWEMRAIGAEERPRNAHPVPDPVWGSTAERWRLWSAGVSGLLTALRVGDEARTVLERRYLDGRVTLFPDIIERWGRLQEAVESLAVVAGLRAGEMPQVGPPPDRVAAAVEHLLRWARARALDIVGDRDDATAIIGRWLRDGGA